MAKYGIPSAPAVYRSRYEGFVGCDFNTDPMCVDDRRFPYAQNLVLDTNGYPEKRPGYKEVISFGGAPSKLFRAVIDGKTYLLTHAGSSVFVNPVSDSDVSSESLCELKNVKNCFFVARGDKVFVYGLYDDGSGFVQKLSTSENGMLSFSDAVPDAYVPETSIAGRVLPEEEYAEMMKHGEASSGGQSYENVNLLASARVNTFGLSELNLVNENYHGADAIPVRFDSPLFCVLDSGFSVCNEEFKTFLLGLFLRMYCVNGECWFDSDTDRENLVFDENYQYYWSDLYGDEAYDKYKTFVRKAAGKEGATISSFTEDYCVYIKSYADALCDFVEESYADFSKHVPPGNPDNTCTEFYFKNDCGFSFKIYDSSFGWIDFPFAVHAAMRNYNRFELCFDFGEFDGDYDSFKESLEKGISCIRLLRCGYIPYDANNEDKARTFVPDINEPANIRVQFTVSGDSFQSNIKKVVSSDICRLYGVSGAADRVFVKGVGDEQHYVRFSEMDNPLYFPDLNYITCGSPSTAVVDMFPFSTKLCIAKEQNFQDVSFFIAEGTMADGEAVFLVKEGLPGAGLKSRGAFALCEDIPHFLSDNGVFYLTSVDITARSTIKNCSYFADSVIAKEKKAGARLFYYKQNLLLSFPESGHIYVFNTRDKAYSSHAGTDHYVYEVWLWTDVEATDFICFGDALYFITKDGALMRFKEHGSVNCYSDEYGGEHHAIDAYFKTKAFDDGSFMTLKNMRKRGCGVALKPFTRSSATVYVITDRDELHLKDIYADVFDWTYIDFCRFEFTANPAIRILPFNTKVKKYATIQFYVRNNEVGESFGVIGIEKAYTLGNFKKN